MRLHALRQWQNRHGRFYDVPHLVRRVWDQRGPLSMTVLLVQNYAYAGEGTYCRYAAVLEKAAE